MYYTKSKTNNHVSHKYTNNNNANVIFFLTSNACIPTRIMAYTKDVSNRNLYSKC